MKFRFVEGVELVEKDEQRLLMARHPLSLLRLNESLASLLRRIRDGIPWRESPDSVNILHKISEMGFLERWWQEAGDGDTEYSPSVSVVIPVKDRARDLQRCLESLSSLQYPREKLEVIVVDDGSRDGSLDVAKTQGTVVLSSGGEGLGPAMARNVGAKVARGEILAFIDSDCVAKKDWLSQLLPVFGDAEIAAVGGMVAGLCTTSSLDRYEEVMSSLNLGFRERFAREGSDTFYLPSCNLLVKKSAFFEADCFNSAMHVGEDVDLSYRLRDRGWRIAYVPAGEICHAHRNGYLAFMRRRFDYGTSEEMLQRRHPLRKKRIPVPRLLALALVCLLSIPVTGGWGGAAGIAFFLTDCTIYSSKVHNLGARLKLSTLFAGRLRAVGGLGYFLCCHLGRYYTPLFLLLGLFFPSALPLAGLAILFAAAVDYRIKRPKLIFPGFMGIYLLEQIAYGFGVLWGCLRNRNFRSYLVVMR